MDIAHILEELSYDTGELPREAIEAACAKREEITAHLLAILETAVNRVDEIILQDNYQGHLYAMYLLAQFREKKALPLIMKLISFPREIPHAILGDVLTEDLGRILASLTKSDLSPLFKLIENKKIDEYVRAAALSGLVTLVGVGIVEREEIYSYLSSLLSEKLERKPSFVWDTLLASLCELHPKEAYPEIIRAFQDHLFDESLIDLAATQSIMAKSRDALMKKLFDEAELIDDTVVEMEKWFAKERDEVIGDSQAEACFDKATRDKKGEDDQPDGVALKGEESFVKGEGFRQNCHR